LDQYLLNIGDENDVAGAYLVNATIPSDNAADCGSVGKKTAYSAGSVHSGGANVALCDGTVHFIGDNIDSATWKSLGGISDARTLRSY